MRRTRAVIATVFLAGGMSACGVAHPGISNGSVSACFRAIPPAKAAIGNAKATLIGVHRIPADSVRSRLPAAAQAELAAENDTTVCAIAFKGTFAAGQVTLAPPTKSGSYAIVLVGSRHLRVIASVVLEKLPHSLGKRTL